MTRAQLDAIGDAYSSLRAIYETYKDGEQAGLAVLAGESMAGLVAAFPHIAELETLCTRIEGESR